ncbi:MAG: hypothetical protein R3E68_04070 [Burkholderiaceae bacterium]
MQKMHGRGDLVTFSSLAPSDNVGRMRCRLTASRPPILARDRFTIHHEPTPMTLPLQEDTLPRPAPHRPKYRIVRSDKTAGLAGAGVDAESAEFYLPYSERLSTRPVWICPAQNRWCMMMRITGSGELPLFRHVKKGFRYTVAGRWRCSGQDWIANRDDLVFHDADSEFAVETFADDEPTILMATVEGPVHRLDDQGRVVCTVNVADYLRHATRYLEASGQGTKHLASMIR